MAAEGAGGAADVKGTVRSGVAGGTGAEAGAWATGVGAGCTGGAGWG